MLGENNKIFADAGLCFSFPSGDIKQATLVTSDNGVSYNGEHAEYKMRTAFGLNFGIGYTYQKKYGIAIRYLTNRDFLTDVASNFKTSISRVGVSLSYTLN